MIQKITIFSFHHHADQYTKYQHHSISYAKALICGLPILLSGFIPGQEEGNVPFVVENGVGSYSADPAEIAAILSGWFGPEREGLAQMGAKAKALGRPQAAFAIVEEIVALLEK